MPDNATMHSFTNNVIWYAVERSPTSTSTRFHTPVSSSTPNAGHAMRLN